MGSVVTFNVNLYLHLRLLTQSVMKKAMEEVSDVRAQVFGGR